MLRTREGDEGVSVKNMGGGTFVSQKRTPPMAEKREGGGMVRCKQGEIEEKGKDECGKKNKTRKAAVMAGGQGIALTVGGEGA